MAKRSRNLELREPPKELTVGQVAARAGVAVSAIHFYESRGLIRGWRTPGNQRRYPRVVLRRIAVIKVAQRVGISLRAIRAALASLPKDRTPTAKDWAALSVRLALRSTDIHLSLDDDRYQKTHPRWGTWTRSSYCSVRSFGCGGYDDLADRRTPPRDSQDEA